MAGLHRLVCTASMHIEMHRTVRALVNVQCLVGKTNLQRPAQVIVKVSQYGATCQIVRRLTGSKTGQTVRNTFGLPYVLVAERLVIVGWAHAAAIIMWDGPSNAWICLVDLHRAGA